MKSSAIKIRQAKPADFAKVAEMHYPVWRRSWAGIMEDYVLDLITTPKLWATVKYPEALSRSGWRMWVAESGRKILGMVIFGPDITHPDQLLIEALYTAEEGQGLGIGGRLLDKAMRSNPSGDVILWCAEKNRAARQYYEDKDFRVDGRAYVWTPLPGVRVPHVGYRLYRSEQQG